MSTYIPPSVGERLELKDDLTIKGIRVYDSIMGLSSNFTNWATNITGTDLNITGNANIGGFITCNRVSVSSLTPTNSSHLTSKHYVDNLIPTASGNLTKTGVNITLNTSISLTGVTLTGAFVGTTGAFSGVVSCATPTLAGNAATKAYVDNLVNITASGNITRTLNNFTLNPSISLTGISLTGAFVGTTGTFSDRLSLYNGVNLSAGPTEAYTLSDSSKFSASPSGTVATIGSSTNSINGSSLINMFCTNAANDYSNIFFGVVAGNITNGPANFVIGRRASGSSWDESLRIDTTGTMLIQTTGIGVPTFTTRSSGTKLVIKSTVDASNVDYGIGLETSNL